MSRNESLGTIQVYEARADELNDAYREVVRRIDELKGLNGPVTIQDDLSVTGSTTVQALTVEGETIITALDALEAVTLTTIPDPADAPASADALRDDLVANVLPAIRTCLEDLRDAVNGILAGLS